MIQNQYPVRKNTPQSLDYTFTDPRTKQVIDLSSYVSVTLELKRQGTVITSLISFFVLPTQGTVNYPSYTFPNSGLWTAQFYCADMTGNKLYGEPLRFTVVDNVDDLTGDNMPNY